MSDRFTDAELFELDPDHQDRSLPALVHRRITGTFQIDEWGYDPDLTHLLAPLVPFGALPGVDAVDQLPEVGPALMIMDHRPSACGTVLVAAAVARRCHRPVRFLGVPDLAPVGPLLRRIGGAPADACDLRALLRSGALVLSAGERPWWRPLDAGRPPAALLETARDQGAPIVPVAVRGSRLGPPSRVVVGAPVSRRRLSGHSVDALVSLVGEQLAALGAS